MPVIGLREILHEFTSMVSENMTELQVYGLESSKIIKQSLLLRKKILYPLENRQKYPHQLPLEAFPIKLMTTVSQWSTNRESS